MASQAEAFWTGEAKEWLQLAIVVAVLGFGLGSCTMLESYGEAAKIAAGCAVKK